MATAHSTDAFHDDNYRADEDPEADPPFDGDVEKQESQTAPGAPDAGDGEKGDPPLAEDPNLVTWDSPTDPANPKNWTTKKKWLATVVVSSFTFVSPVSSSMVAPSVAAIAAEFNISSTVEQELTLSIFVLAYAVGPLFFGPLSEIYGRVPVLQLANLFYLIFDAACGGARNKTMLYVFRFLSGLGGSASLAIGGGLLADIFRPEERGRAIAIYTLMPLLGPAIGPIAGGFITETTTWRWSFYATAIFDALVQLSGVCFLQETYAPALLHQKAQRLRQATGNAALRTEYERPERKLLSLLKTALSRPLRLIATQPIVQFLAVYMAYLYGLMYLVLATFPALWTGAPPAGYGQSVGVGGLNYISLGLGFSLGTQLTAPLNDRLYRRLKARNAGVGRPEFRVPLMLPGALVAPLGLFLYGWAAQFADRVHWIVPNIGACVFATGTIVGFQCVQIYLVDSYTRYAASALAAATVLRSLAGFGFPLFAPTMFQALGLGWGCSLLGFVALGLGVPAPLVLWFYGQKLRARSKFAAGG